MLCTPDKRPSNYRLVPPHDIFDRKDRPELKLPDEREQEAFHPIMKVVRVIEKKRYEGGAEESGRTL